MSAQEREASDPQELENKIPLSVTSMIGVLVIWALIYIFWSHQTVKNQLTAQDQSEKIHISEQKAPSTKINTQQEVANRQTAQVSAKPTMNGESIYNSKCSACHQKNGQGIAGVFPPLNSSEWVTGDPGLTIAVIAKGLTGSIQVNGSTYNGMMPAFEASMSADEISAVTSYIRNSWANQAGDINLGEVNEVLERFKAQKSPWQGEKVIKDHFPAE